MKYGYVNEMRMHGQVFSKIDDLRSALEKLALNLKIVITYNRFYLNGDVVCLNIDIDKRRYLISVYDKGYEVSRFNNKTSQSEKFKVEYEHIANGSFMGLFSK